MQLLAGQRPEAWHAPYLAGKLQAPRAKTKLGEPLELDAKVMTQKLGNPSTRAYRKQLVGYWVL